MLSKITLFTTILFAALYPLSFWIGVRSPLKNNFHRFHIGLPNVLAGIVSFFLIRSDYSINIKLLSFFWAGGFCLLTSYYWKKETVNIVLTSVISLLGSCLFIYLHTVLISFNILLIISWFLGGIIFVMAFYAMNLGHWYLNVSGLSMKYLKSANTFLWVCVGVRLILDIYVLMNTSLIIYGDNMRLLSFITHIDGFFINIALFFGIIFPIIGLWYTNETIKLKNTQSTTGILYVILCGIILADITFKYYALSYGIAL